MNYIICFFRISFIFARKGIIQSVPSVQHKLVNYYTISMSSSILRYIFFNFFFIIMTQNIQIGEEPTKYTIQHLLFFFFRFHKPLSEAEKIINIVRVYSVASRLMGSINRKSSLCESKIVNMCYLCIS